MLEIRTMSRQNFFVISKVKPRDSNRAAFQRLQTQSMSKQPDPGQRLAQPKERLNVTPRSAIVRLHYQ